MLRPRALSSKEQKRAYLVFFTHTGGDVIFEIPGKSSWELRAELSPLLKWLSGAAQPLIHRSRPSMLTPLLLRREASDEWLPRRLKLGLRENAPIA